MVFDNFNREIFFMSDRYELNKNLAQMLKGGVKIPMTFIRAPYISDFGSGVTPLATVDGKTVAAVQGNRLVCAFHPELGENTYVHEYFLNMVKNAHTK